MAIRVEDKDVRAAGALLAVGCACHPVGQHHSLAVAHCAISLQSDPGHEALRRIEVHDQIGNAIDQAEPVSEPHLWCRDTGQCRLANSPVGLRPRPEPGVHQIACPAVHFVGDHVGEQRQLISPALHVVVAHGRIGECMHQMQPRV